MSLLVTLGAASMVFVAAFTWHAATRAPGAGQSPRSAIVEAWTNLAIGFAINFVASQLIVPIAIEGGHLSLISNWWMGWIFTAISIVRQYAIRRWFNNAIT